MDAAVALPFTKFVILPSELRSHILSYNDYKTWANYAPCSKLCNMDIQQYNTRPPCHVIFHHGETSAMVELTYKRSNYFKLNYALKFVKLEERVKLGKRQNDLITGIKASGKVPNEVALQYVMDRFKYVKTGECALLDFYGDVYLPELLTIPQIRKFHWRCVFDAEMYPKFYDSVKNEKNERLGLRLVPGTDKVYNIPVKFFRTEFFQNLSHFDCKFHLTGLKESDFLAMKVPKITIECSTISDRAINRKVQQWASNPTYQPVDYNFFRSSKLFNKNVVSKNLNIVDTTNTFYTSMEIQHPSGSRAAFSYHDYGTALHFRTI